MHSVVRAAFGPERCVGCRVRAGILCERCRAGLRPPFADAPTGVVSRIVAAWRYEGAARALVLDLKLRARRGAAGPLVDAMRDAVLARGLTGTVLTWVPGRTADIRRRGYDHAEVLAHGVAARLGLPCAALLERAAPALDQAGLSATARRRNLKGAFSARKCAARVVLVDDLVTTGATARACGKALLDAGAARVEALVPCRA